MLFTSRPSEAIRTSDLRFFVGLDLGQAQDFTTVSILERREVVGPRDPVHLMSLKIVELRLRHLERFPLQTPYPDVVSRVSRIMRNPKLARISELIPDGTGVGTPVVDLLRQERMPCLLSPVKITSGFNASKSDGYHHVPKRNLILGLQIALQKGVLRIGRNIPFRDTLFQEMTQMRVELTDAGNERYEPWRRGMHDDLVLAVSLSCWAARNHFPNDYSSRPQFFHYYVR